MIGFDFDGVSNNHGGAVLADSTCGSGSLTTSAGETISFKVEHDPEWAMSGLLEPCGSFDKW